MNTKTNSANGAMLSPAATQMETASGLFVDLSGPSPSDINIRDIAQHLALTCRYGGAVSEFYSVAEHSVLVHDLLRHMGAPVKLQIAGLFHDAAEAYLGDVVAPLKYALRRNYYSGDAGIVDAVPLPTYDVLTERMEAAIAARFDLDPALFADEQVMLADMWALRIEASALCATGGANWRWPGELPEGGELPEDIMFNRLTWAAAREVFLNTAWAHGFAK